MADNPPSSSGSSGGLCTSCGICCSGILFDTAPVEESERERLTAHGLKIYEEDGEQRFSLPCVRFSGCCTIYEDRPGICQRYRCKLLRNFEAGEIPLDECLGRVAEAKRLIAQLPDSLRWQDHSVGHQWVKQFREWKAKKPAERAEEVGGGFLLQLIILNRFLDEHFRDKGQRRLVEKTDGAPRPVAADAPDDERPASG